MVIVYQSSSIKKEDLMMHYYMIIIIIKYIFSVSLYKYTSQQTALRITNYKKQLHFKCVYEINKKPLSANVTALIRPTGITAALCEY